MTRAFLMVSLGALWACGDSSSAPDAAPECTDSPSCPAEEPFGADEVTE